MGKQAWLLSSSCAAPVGKVEFRRIKDWFIFDSCVSKIRVLSAVFMNYVARI